TGENTNANITLTFTGTGMSATDCIPSCAATLHNANGTNINGTSFTPGTTSATAHFNLTGATLGTSDVRVTNLSGTGVCTACFTVTAANPSGISPSPNQAGQSATGVAVTITGAHFQSGATVAFSNSGITIDSTHFISSGEIDVVIHVSATGS